MTRESVTEKFLNSVVLTLIARATILAAPFVVAFTTWLFLQAYNQFETSQERMQDQIRNIQTILQDHENRLKNGKDARLEFQENTARQFAKLDTQLSLITEKLASVSDNVIRVQTIIEARLPTRQGSLGTLNTQE